MLHGDLSNQSGFVIAFRCEDSLVEFKEDKLLDKVFNAIKGKVKRAELNNDLLHCMEHLYRNTDYNVDLVIEEKEYTKEMRELLDPLPFGRVILVTKDTQISQRLLLGDITFYVDEKEERRGQINSQYAISLAQLNDYIKRR